MLYKAEVYDPTLDVGRDQYLFYFHFDEYAPRRWSSDHARHISWWIASQLAVLQLCRSGLICWANAPCVIGFRSFQVEAIRTGSHPSGGWLVSAFFLVVPGRRGVARRARSARRSRHGVALGPAVCPRNGTTFAL